MATLTDFARNKINDALWRGQALGAPATRYYALFVANKGIRANTTTYALNDTIVALINAAYVFYKCTTAGTSAAAQPGAYLGVAGEVVTDGAAVFTEQTAALRQGSINEVASAGGYSRVAVTASLANFAGTQGAGTTAISSGTTGQTSNNNAITFPVATAAWANGLAMVVGMATFDAATGGNMWDFQMLTAPQTVNAGATPPSFPAAAWNYFTDK